MDATFSPEDELQDSVSRMSALDLYEDLLIDEDKDDGNRVFTMQEILDEKKLLEAQNACLLNQISEMKLRMAEMSEENSRLQQHFDSLLATAKVELDRKNDLLNRYQTKCVCGSVSFPVNAACKDIFRKVERVAHKPKQKKKCLADLFKGRRVTEEELRRPGKTTQPIAPKKTPSDSKRGKKSTSVNAQSRKINNNSGSGKTLALSNDSKELSPRRSARGKDADKRPSSKVVKACRDSENVKKPEQLSAKKTDLPLPTRDIALSQYAVIDEVADAVDISVDSLDKSTNNDIGITDTHSTQAVSTTVARGPAKQKATSKRKSNEPRKIHRSPHVNLPQGPHRPLSQSQNVRQIAVTCSLGVSLSSRPPKRSNSSVSIDKCSTGSPPFKKSRKSNKLQAARAQERGPNSASGVLNANKSRNEQVLSITTRDLCESMDAPVLERNATSQSDQFVGKVTQPGNSGKTKDNGIAEMSDAGIGCPDTTDAKRSDVKESSTNCESRYLAENDERQSASVNNNVEDHIRPHLDATALSNSKKRDSSLKRRDKPTLSASTSNLPDSAISSLHRNEFYQGSSLSTGQTVEAGGSMKTVKKGKKPERIRFSAGQVPVGFQPKVRLVDIRTRTPVKDGAESATVKGDEPRTGKRRLFTQQSPDSPERMEACDDVSIGSQGRTQEIASTLQEADDVLFTDLQLSGDSDNIDSAPDGELTTMFNASAVTSVEKNCRSAQPDGLEDNSCTIAPSEPITTPSKDIATSSKQATTTSEPTTTSSKHVITPSKHATTPVEPSATISKHITTPSKRTSSELTTSSSKLVTIPSEPTASIINHSTPSERTTIISEHATTPSKHVTTPSQPTTSSNHGTPSKRTTAISEHTATPSQHTTTSSNHSTPSKRAATISEATTTPSKDVITPSSKRTITPSKFRRRAANVPPSQTAVRSPAPKEITPSKNSVRPAGTLSSWLATARSSSSNFASDCGNSGQILSVDVPDKVDTVRNDEFAAKLGNSRNAALRWLVKLGLEELEGKRRASQSRSGDRENGVEQAAAKGVVTKSFFHSQRKMWLTSLEKCQQRRKENAKWSS